MTTSFIDELDLQIDLYKNTKGVCIRVDGNILGRVQAININIGSGSPEDIKGAIWIKQRESLPVLTKRVVEVLRKYNFEIWKHEGPTDDFNKPLDSVPDNYVLYTGDGYVRNDGY